MLIHYRSYLFVPANSPKKLERSVDSGADALILDLEDAVAADAKPRARKLVGDFLERSISPARFVRVNALPSEETEADIAATISKKPNGYVLPKCEGLDHVEALSALIEKHGGDESVCVMAIATETVRAVRHLMRDDWSHRRLSALTWGGEDLAANMGALSNRDATGQYLGPFRLASDLTLFAAIDAGVAPVDAVYTAFRDTAGLEIEARSASALGFVGKLAIHPAQVPVINAAFMPTAEQVDWAKAVMKLSDEAGGGVAWLDGEMLDAPHYKRAQHILSRVTQSAAR